MKNTKMRNKHSIYLKGGHLRTGQMNIKLFMYCQYAQYTTVSRRKEVSVLLNNLDCVTRESSLENPYPKLLIPYLVFGVTVIVNEVQLLTLAVMDLLVRYVYPSVKGYVKANIIFIMKKENEEEILKPLKKKSIPLTLDNGTLIPKFDITNHVSSCIQQLLEFYDGFTVIKIIIRVYFQDNIILPLPIISDEDRLRAICKCLYSHTNSINIDVSNLPPRSLRSTKRVYSSHIPRLKKSVKISLSPFLVADIETILIDNVHFPYAIGVMMVFPGEKLMLNNIYTYFSEDYSSVIFPTFKDRSTQILKSFINRVETITRRNKKYKMNTVYFHNLSRFDGIFILKHLLLHHINYRTNPLLEII